MAPPRQTTFIIHIWWEQETPTQLAWRGRVQHVLSGESIGFREPELLWRFLDHWSCSPGQPAGGYIQPKQTKGRGR